VLAAVPLESRVGASQPLRIWDSAEQSLVERELIEPARAESLPARFLEFGIEQPETWATLRLSPRWKAARASIPTLAETRSRSAPAPLNSVWMKKPNAPRR